MKSSTIKKSQDNYFFGKIWQRSLTELLFIMTAIFLLYINTINQMVHLWSASDTYAHGFIVPFITLWLIWRVRENWLTLTPEPSISAWLLMLCAAGLWLAGDLVVVNAVTQLALVMLIILSVPATLGWKVASTIKFPLFFLFFAVPIGDFMLPTMMEWTADFTVVALRFTGIPVYREGLQFVIPSGTWSVVEACSGIRYLIASVTVGCLFAYLNYRSFAKRFLFIGISIIVPLIANWLRAYMIVLIGHYSGNELATGVDHIIYGWLFFGFVIGLMLYMGGRWADDIPVKSEQTDKNTIISIDNNVLFIKNKKNYIVLGIFIIIALPHILQIWFNSKLRELPVELEKVFVVSPWKNINQPPSEWAPSFLHAASYSHSGFELSTGEQVGLYISYYRRQDYKSKLVTSTNELVTNQNREWIRLSSESKIAFLKDKPFRVNNTVLRYQGPAGSVVNSNLQVWKFYWVNGKFITSDIEAKIQGVLSRISGAGDDGAIIALYTPFILTGTHPENIESGNKILQEFLEANSASIINALEITRNK